MKLAHNITVTVFCKPEDNEAKVKKAFVSLFPFDMEKEKISISEQNSTGFGERKIKILEARLKKWRNILSFLENLKKNLGQMQNKKVAEEAESRIDDELHFFIRLDKGGLVGENRHILTDKGGCFHIKISLAVFPKKREKAGILVRGFFWPNR